MGIYRVLLWRFSWPCLLETVFVPVFDEWLFSELPRAIEKNVTEDIHFLAMFAQQLTVQSWKTHLLMSTFFPGTRTQRCIYRTSQCNSSKLVIQLYTQMLILNMRDKNYV